jgi:hypothetical protein
MIFDLDATDDPLHRHQEDRFFHLLLLSAAVRLLRSTLLAARLRRSNIDGAAGSHGIKIPKRGQKMPAIKLIAV